VPVYLILQAALRKFLKTTKAKIRSGKDKKPDNQGLEDEEFERRKQQWQV